MLPIHKKSADLDDLNERLRCDVIRTIEPYGTRAVADLTGMSDSDRTKWFFWNVHENLEAMRHLEPTVVGQIVRTQLTVSDGQSMWTSLTGLEKRVELSCKWQLLLKPSNFEAEHAYSISDGWIDLFVGSEPPPHPVLQAGQKGYLDSDNAMYPNQLFLYGWISDGVWQELKPQLYNASANCHTDIYLRDNFIFPVKSGVNFLNGPAGAIGITNIEFRTSTQPRLTSWTRP